MNSTAKLSKNVKINLSELKKKIPSIYFFNACQFVTNFNYKSKPNVLKSLNARRSSYKNENMPDSFML